MDLIKHSNQVKDKHEESLALIDEQKKRLQFQIDTPRDVVSNFMDSWSDDEKHQFNKDWRNDDFLCSDEESLSFEQPDDRLATDCQVGKGSKRKQDDESSPRQPLNPDKHLNNTSDEQINIAECLTTDGSQDSGSQEFTRKKMRTRNMSNAKITGCCSESENDEIQFYQTETNNNNSTVLDNRHGYDDNDENENDDDDEDDDDSDEDDHDYDDADNNGDDDYDHNYCDNNDDDNDDDDDHNSDNIDDGDDDSDDQYTQDEPLKIEFNIFVQFMLSSCINQEFLESQESDNSYFGEPKLKVEGKLTNMRELVNSQAWKKEFREALEALPNLRFQSIQFHDGCDACQRQGRVASTNLTFSGPYYDKETFEHVGYYEQRKMSFDVGRFCATRSKLYHRIYHYKYKLYHKCNESVNRFNESQSEADVVEKCLDDEEWMLNLYKDFSNMINSATKLYTTDDKS